MGGRTIDWVYLFVAGVLEIGWAIGLKYTEGFSKLWPSVMTIASMIVSMLLLAMAVRSIPLGTGYAIWTGIGAVGTAVAGMALFGESAAGPRVLFILVVLLGIVGLKMTSGH